MPSCADLSPDSRFFGLFVGPTKSGKTVAAASFPAPVEIWDFDGRIRGLLGAPWIDRSQIRYESFPPEEVDMVIRFDKFLDTMLIKSRTNQPLPKTLIVDSMTSYCAAMIMQALPITHVAGSKGSNKGRMLGPLQMAGIEDYGFESQAATNLVTFLRSIPIPNIIVSAHVVPKYAKEDPSKEYSPTIEKGERLSLRDKIAANIGIYFDHCFRFDKDMFQGKERYQVCYRGELASTSYAGLPL